MIEYGRVNAHKASAILVQMTAEDLEEYNDSGQNVKNGATIRSLSMYIHYMYPSRTIVMSSH